MTGELKFRRDIIVSIIRISILVNLKVDGDISRTLPPVQILSFVESGVAIIVASLMVCRPVFERVLSSGRKTSTSDPLSLPLREKRSIGEDSQSKVRVSSAASQPFPMYSKAEVTHAQGTSSTHQDMSTNNILVTREINVSRNMSVSDLSNASPKPN